MALEMQQFGTNFLDEAWSIDQDINTINGNIRRIQELQQQLLTATSQLQESRNAEDRTALMDQTRSLLFAVKDRIKKIARENARMRQDDPDSSLRRQRHEFLSQKFTKTLEEYRTVENTYMRQQKERVERQYRVVNPAATQDEIDEYVANASNQPVFQQALLHTGEARAALQEVQRRHEDIKRIEQTIAELAQLFEEMRLQVEQSEPVIAQIEESANQTTIKVEEANTNLDKARMSALSARRKKWICAAIILVLLIIVVIIVIIYIPKGNKDNK